MIPLTRLEVQEILKGILGSNNVYFQPPPTLIMNYPCIVYTLSDMKVEHASNTPYTLDNGYQVTHIDRNPESDVPKKLARLQKSRFNRHFKNDNLNHNVFTIYF